MPQRTQRPGKCHTKGTGRGIDNGLYVTNKRIDREVIHIHIG